MRAAEAVRRVGVSVEGEVATVRETVRAAIEWRVMDLRHALPERDVDLVLCRNTAFTYFAPEAQRAFSERVLKRMNAGVWIVVGREEVRGDVVAIMNDLGLRSRGGGVFARG